MSRLQAISADYIFTGANLTPLHNKAIVLDNNTVIDIVNTTEIGNDFTLLKLNGWICPGFVNAHCHLELSWAKGLIKKHTGINGFIQQLVDLSSDSFKDHNSINNAINQAYNSGTVFIADISNTNDSLICKSECSTIKFHTFIEVFGFNPAVAQQKIENAKSLKNDFERVGLKATITPHAPYSASNELLRLIYDAEEVMYSIHFKESESELQLFATRTGAMAHRLSRMGFDVMNWHGAPDPLSYVISNSRIAQHQLWVHNTFIDANDLIILNAQSTNNWFVLCPRANQYIEGRTPPVDLINQLTSNICIGTDSLASNDDLNMWNELIEIQKAFPAIEPQALIHWATQNSAKALGVETEFGLIEKGRKAQLVHIDNTGNQADRINLDSTSQLLKL